MRGRQVNSSFYYERCYKEKCSQNWKGIHAYSAQNDMSPGAIPQELYLRGKITPIEAMILALVHPIIRVYKVRGYGQYKGGKVHVINFPQNPVQVFHIIPRLPHELPVIILRVRNPNGTAAQQPIKDFEIDIHKVQVWMQYLCQHNCYYKDVVQDVSRLNAYVDQLQNMSSQERFELLLDKDWEGGRYEGPENIIGNTELHEGLAVEETGVHAEQMKINEQAALERFLHLRPVSQHLQPEPIQYPRVQPNPINEFTHDGYIVKAFPGLFPTGTADLICTKNRPLKITPVDYFKHLVRYKYGRFAADARFLFFALNTRYRGQLSSTAKFFVRKGQFEMVTVSELREQLNDPLCNLAHPICRYASSIPGLAPFWHQKRGEVSAIVHHDCPHAFATFSAADTHWVDFHRIVEEKKSRLFNIPIVCLENLSEHEAILRRNHNLQNYPQLASEFLFHRFNLFLEEVAYKFQEMKVRDHWFMFEWQFRGSGHLHGFLWIDDAPTLSKIDLENDGDRLQLESFWHHARVRVDTPIKWLYPAPIHPCQHNLPLTEDLSLDLSYLANRVQKHTCGSYCLRKRRRQTRDDNSLHCRFHFPAASHPKTEISRNPD